MAGTLFEKYFNMKEDDKAEAQKKSKRRRLKLRFQSAIASIMEEEAKLEAEEVKINESVTDSDLDINRLIEIADERECLSDDKEKVKKMYEEWFGSKLIDVDSE